MRGTHAFDDLVTSILGDDDREKFEWAVGALLTGAPPRTVVVSGPSQSGKTTLTSIVRHILSRFEGDISPRVAFIEGYDLGVQRYDSDTFVFIETYVTEIVTGRFLHIETVGGRAPIPVNRYHVLMSQILVELDAIAELCIARYRRLGVYHYDI